MIRHASRRAARHARRFLRRDDGAVTVDYVVLTSAAAGLGLAVSGILMGGFGTFAGTVNGELSRGRTVIVDVTSTLYEESFGEAGAADGWSGAQVTDVRGIGSVLGPIAGSGPDVDAPTVTRTFNLADGTTSAVLDFDVLALDSLDGEAGIIFIGKQEIGRVHGLVGDAWVTTSEVDGMTIKYEIVEEDVELGGVRDDDKWSRDSRTRVRVTVTDPGESLTFGFASNAGADIRDESFALDNFFLEGTVGSTGSDGDSGAVTVGTAG
jgi:hypothetical protein